MTKYQQYADYKDSGVEWLGAIPAQWQVKKLKYLGEAIIGLTYSPDDVVDDETQGILVLRSSNVQDKKLAFEDNVYVNKQISEKLRTQKGDILICARNGSRALIGKNALIDESAEGVTFGAFMSVFRSPYNYYLSNVFNSALFEYQSGTFLTATINQLTTANLNNFEVPLPPKEERKKIINFLDYETAQIDSLIEKQQQLIQLLKEKRQAVISHAVTKGLNPNVPMKDSGVEWLGEVPEHWIVTKIGFHTLKIGSGKTPKGGAEIYQDEGVLFIRSQNVYNDGLKIDSSESVYISEAIHDDMATSKVSSGDILLNITGGSIGRSSLVPDGFPEANVNQHVCIIRVHEYIRDFLASVIQSDLIQAQIRSIQTGGNREGLNFEQISKFSFALPPQVERKEIIQYIQHKLYEFKKVEDKANKVVQLMQERRTALISAAVTGKIDVRNWQNPNNNNEAKMEFSA